MVRTRERQCVFLLTSFIQTVIGLHILATKSKDRELKPTHDSLLELIASALTKQ